MSLAFSGAEPQPSLAWTFESSNVDYVTNLAPSSQVSPGPAQLQGSAALVTNAPTSNTAVYFPGGSGDYMNLGTASPANFDCTTSNLFCEMWVYRNTSGQHFIIDNMNSSNKSYAVYFRSDNKIEIDTQTRSAVSTNTIPTGVWTHIAFSIVVPQTSNGIRIFINGNLDTTSANATTETYDATRSVYIGYFIGDSGTMNGYIRDLRVVQGGVVPVATFTPGAAPFSYASPGYVANMGTTVFTLLGQFITYNPSGKYGSSLVLTSSPNVLNYLTYTNTVTLNPSIGVAMVCWVKFITLQTSGQSLLLRIFGPTASMYISTYAGGFQSDYFNGTNYYPSFISQAIATGTWYHVVQVLTSTSVITYLNGVAGPSTSITNPLDLTSTFNIGTAQNPGNRSAFELDDLRIYNTALTSTQVQSVYSSQGAPAPNRAMPLPKLAWAFDGTTTDYVSGVVPTTTTGTISYGNGKYNQCVIFTNTPGSTFTQGLLYTLQNTIDVNNGISVALWVNLSLLDSNQQEFVRINMNTSRLSFGALLSSGFFIQFTDALSTLYTLSVSGTTSNWIHLVAVVTNNTITFYKNGTISGTDTPKTTGLTTSGTVSVGYSSAVSTRGTAGLIDDLRIFDRALTSAQVQAVFNQQGVPGRGVQTANGLIFYAPFNGTTTDSISSVVPTLTGSVSYDSVNAKYTQSLIVTNTPGAYATNYLEYPKTIDIAVTGLTCAFWVRTGTDVTTFQSLVSFRGVAQYQGQIRYELSTTKINMSYWNGKSGGSALSAGVYQVGPVLSTNTWYHLAIAIKPNGNISFYVNAVEYSAGQNCGLRDIYPTGSRVDSFFVGTSAVNPNYQNAFSGEFDDLRLYNYALETPAITSLYNTAGPADFKPPSVSLTGTPLFSQLSSGATSSAVGAFSLRAVNGTSVKAVQVRNGTTSATQDFYADRLGNLLTAPIVGQSLANWLGGATGYVTTWYDQSGKGNHATQATAANQPVISLATTPASVVFTGNGTTSGQYLITGNIPFSIATTGKFGVQYIIANNVGGVLATIGPGNRKWWLGDGNATGAGEATQGNRPSLVGGGESYAISGTAVTSAKTSVVYNSTASGSNFYYINGSSVALSTNTKTWNSNQDGTYPLQIGWSSTFSYYSGNLFEFIMTNTSFTTNDIAVISAT